ncbi:hypothetical protein ACET3X_009460 [Alternaria dauci]|uniref:Uncharacterized protein n=1 Tax=Alternaria dauci TaxID=48095 RepID=A0ABR3U8X7_9PLEO
MAHVTLLPGAEDLSPSWPLSRDLTGLGLPVRLEGEIADVMVRGTIPDAFDGTFYRVGQDQVTPFSPDKTPITGNGIVSAFRIHKGQVDFKVRYVHNDLYKLERKQRRSIWEDVASVHPHMKHPCVSAVIESTSNTNVLYWAGKLLAMGESGPVQVMDPDTLETLEADPFGDQIKTDTFTAHPKIDPHVQELVTYGVFGDLKGFVSYSIDRQGKVKNEHRIRRTETGLCHDIAMTENWLVFCTWPNSLVWKEGADRPAMTWTLIGRQPLLWLHDVPTSHWKAQDGSPGAWEDADGKIVFEGTWPHTIRWFPFWPRKDGQEDPERTEKATIELVRIEIDPSKPDNSKLGDPVVLVDIPNEFCRIDERYYNKPYDHIFMCVYSSPTNITAVNDKHIYETLNSAAMLIKSTGELKVYAPGPECRCQEPVFVPRTPDAPEGDGYVIFAVDRLDVNLTNLVILDTKEFEKPVAVIELPLRMRAQIHGNWVDASELNGKPLVAGP